MQLPAAVFGGVLGLLIWSRSVRWAHSTWLFVKARRGQSVAPFEAPPAYMVVINPAPWLFGAFLFFAFYILSKPHNPTWVWFFSGAVVLPAFAVSASLLSLRRSQARARARAGHV